MNENLKFVRHIKIPLFFKEWSGCMHLCISKEYLMHPNLITARKTTERNKRSCEKRVWDWRDFDLELKGI